MKDILDEIITDKRRELIITKEVKPIEKLHAIIERHEFTKRSMSQSLANSPSGIISEFKRRSPSKGWINQYADITEIALGYQQSGASAISILTNEHYFGGSLEDFIQAREVATIPLLRKEFIVDEYQLIEAKSVGADAVLLIAAALSVNECRDLAKLAQSLDLEVLLELHTESELNHISQYVDMVGINNRNLGTFHTDIDNSFLMADLLPKELVRVSESGIDSIETIKSLQAAGYQGFLIGEQFMKYLDPVVALKEFIEELTK